ncbi:c-type cytochrome [Marimonas lutisalis]|uniref:c-type cytochrome n=1 Tax=Marimonas lutisalis TaxID=2545756 RepID=UPI0010F5E1CD|nr:cytochrome c [Marimonas lutisalis]
MKKTLTALTGLALAGAVATTALSGSHGNEAAMAAVKARKAQMQLYAFNIGLLGGMAKGEIEYNADAASAAASNLAALSKLDQSRLWPAGSDNMELGTETAALPAIWDADSDVMAKGTAFVEAAAAMEQAAGGGLDSLKGAIGPLGASCGGCHKAYRQPNN